MTYFQLSPAPGPPNKAHIMTDVIPRGRRSPILGIAASRFPLICGMPHRSAERRIISQRIPSGIVTVPRERRYRIGRFPENVGIWWRRMRHGDGSMCQAAELPLTLQWFKDISRPLKNAFSEHIGWVSSLLIFTRNVDVAGASFMLSGFFWRLKKIDGLNQRATDFGDCL